MQRAVGERGRRATGRVFFVNAVLDGEAPAFEGLEVVEFDGFGCAFDGFKFDVAESV